MYKSTFMGLNTALRGVLAHQNALDVTGHNLSNISTDGYTRQRAEMVTAPAWSNSSAMSAVTPGQMGTGVEVLRIERLRDQFIDANVRQQFGRQADSQALVEQLTQVEAAFGEPGENGIGALFNNFWSAMNQVANKPNDTGARQAFAEAADALADGFNQVAADLGAVQAQSDARLNQTVSEVNNISQRIAALNAEIRNALEHNHQPNDLLDERDRLMDGLSKLINFTAVQSTTGEVTITFGATTPVTLVGPSVAGGFNTITRATIDQAFNDFLASGNANDLSSGRAFADESLWHPTEGIIAGTNPANPGYLTQLDALVADFVAGVNAGNAAGFDLNGNPGGTIFLAGGTTAATISLDPGNNIMLNPNLIAASSAAGEPNNGQNLRTMLDLTTVDGSGRNAGQTALGGRSWEAFYASTVTALGARAERAGRDMSNSDVLVEMATGRRDQVSGVSMDEEMSNMLRFQHAYNASARVMTTMDEALDMIINRMGRVGL